MEHEKITIKQAEQKLKETSIEWVDKDLKTGIELPVHYWKGGHYKQLFSMMTYKSYIIPFILSSLIFLTLAIQEWKAFGILAGIGIFFTFLGKLLHQRTRMKVLLSEDALTFVHGRKKTVIPWNHIKKIDYITEIAATGVEKRGRYCRPTEGITYEIVIQTDNRYYNFYDVYENDFFIDENGKANLPALPLHIVCRLMQAAWNKVR